MKHNTFSVTLTAMLFLFFTIAAQANTELISNGGFETGFLGWSAGGPVGSGGCDQSFVVGSNGSSSGCAGFSPIPAAFVSPLSGGLAAYAAFDGVGPLTRSLTQSFFVPISTGNAILDWSDSIGFGSGWIFPQARVYSVSLLNSSGTIVDTILQANYSNVSGGIFQNWTNHSVDISSFLSPLSGQFAQIQFSLYIPQSFTGPGVYALDNVSLSVASVPEADTYAMLIAGLGLMGFVARRKAA